MADEATAKDIIQRADRLFTDASSFRAAWQEIGDYMLPGRRNFNGIANTGQRSTDYLFDGTAISASHLLAASIHGSMTSPDSVWAYLRAQDDYINDSQPCAVWLDDTTRRMHWHFQQSNLYAEIGEVYLDEILFGTADLYSTEKNPASPTFSGFRFKAFPCGDFVIDENAEGIVDEFYLPYQEYSARAMVQSWPETCSDSVRQTAEKDPFAKVQVVYGVRPRKNGTANGFASRMPWEAVWLERNTQTILESSGHNEMPHHVPRWTKGPGEVYGRGPAWFALPDTKSLNGAKKLELDGWALSIRPPYKRLEHQIVGRVRLTPGGETLVRNLDDIKQLFDVKTDWNATQVKSQEIQRGIREIFFRDQLELVENDRMTATEVQSRVELMQRFLGPALGRNNSELLQPLIQRCFLMLYRRGGLLPPPPEMSAYIRSGGALQIRYEGPLARAQRLSELSAVQRAMNTFAAMVQLDPRAARALDNVDWDGVADIVLDATGVSARGRRDPRQRDRMRQEMARQMAEQAQMGQVSQIAESAGRAAPALKALMPAAGQEGNAA